jgi:hypothetical protein
MKISRPDIAYADDFFEGPMRPRLPLEDFLHIA